MRYTLAKLVIRLCLLGLPMLVGACSTAVEDMPELSNTTLCDIVAHRDESLRVRRAAEDELERRGVECDRLAAVMRRRELDALRSQIRNDTGIIIDDTVTTYSDCVLKPTCNETR